MRGVILWHDGDLDGAVELLDRAVEIAEQVGRSEVAFEALHALAIALRDRGDHADADQALARALDLCERAGLVAQSVEATAARAVNLALWGKAEKAREVAEEAAGLADRLRYPVGVAASLEARGAAAADPAERARLLGEAREAWSRLGRAIDAERCERLSSGCERVSAWRQQAVIDAPAASVWALVGDPKRYPEWARTWSRSPASPRSPRTRPSRRPRRPGWGPEHDDLRDRAAR